MHHNIDVASCLDRAEALAFKFEGCGVQHATLATLEFEYFETTSRFRQDIWPIEPPIDVCNYMKSAVKWKQTSGLFMNLQTISNMFNGSILATYLLRSPQKLRICTEPKFSVVCEEVIVDQVAHLRWQIHKPERCFIVKLVELLDVHAAVLFGLRRDARASLDEGAELVALYVVVAEAVFAESHAEGRWCW